MIITNALVYEDTGCFTPRDVEIAGELFGPSNDDKTLNAHGLRLIPGLVDIHVHGCMGQDFCNGTREAIRTLTAYEASQGVLAICPATMTYPEGKLASIADAARAWVAEGEHAGCADLIGINMEGPFISPQRVGAQNPAWVQGADVAMFRRLQERAGGLIKLVDVAPEEPGNLDFIRELAGEVGVSLAHTCASYDEAKAAFDAGARQCTHLWNAMPPLHHREPGVIGAAAERDDVRVELICDGIHSHPATVRLTFKLFGRNVVMISDSMEATGMADGTYSLGGQEVQVHGKLATLANGTIAGSATNLMDCVRCAVQEMGVPLGDAVRAASTEPARAIGKGACYGRVAPGCVAHGLLVDDALAIHAIILRGRVLTV